MQAWNQTPTQVFVAEVVGLGLADARRVSPYTAATSSTTYRPADISTWRPSVRGRRVHEKLTDT